MHNVIHLMTPFCENEFTYVQSNVTYFFTHFFDSPLSYSLSFFGWLGVSFFIFVSGYGLSATYDNANIDVVRWTTRHYLKLVILLFPAFFIFFLFQIYYTHGTLNYLDYLQEQLLLLNITAPFRIPIGILWYIGMAFQLYLWFLLFRKLPNKYLVMIALASAVLIGFLPRTPLSYIRHNSIGWLPEFIFGLLLARYKNINTSGWRNIVTAVIAAIATIALSACRYTFFLSGICFVILLLTFKKYASKSKTLIFVGEISASLYVIHAFVRTFWLLTARHFELQLPPPICGLIVLISSICISIMYDKCYKTACRKLFG